MLLYGQIFKHKVRSHGVIKDPDKYSVCEVVGVLGECKTERENMGQHTDKGS